MALGFNPQKTSVSYEDNTGISAPKPHKKLGRHNKKITPIGWNLWVQ